MSDPQPNQPPIFNPPPVPGNNSFYKILWLLFAFIPTVFGIVCLQIKGVGEWWMSALLVLDFICSVSAGIALMMGIEKRWLQILLGFLLTGSFLGLNIFIIFFIGCTEAMVRGNL